jgi:putative inorganic carbon (HCO3(-)) transporter
VTRTSRLRFWSEQLRSPSDWLAPSGTVPVCVFSRSGLIALASMMIAGVIVGGRWRRWAALLLVFSAAGGIAYFAVLAPLSARNRVTSADTSGRSTIWKVGWRIVQAHPLLGAGSGNFQDVTIHYLHAPGTLTRADLIVVTPKVAHNIYLEMLADMGIPGLLAFLVLVGASVAAAWKAAKAFQRSGDQAMELMSRSAILAIVGFMTSDFFLSGQFSKQLWLAFGLGPTLLMLSRSTVRDPAVSPSIVASARSGRRLARAPA